MRGPAQYSASVCLGQDAHSGTNSLLKWVKRLCELTLPIKSQKVFYNWVLINVSALINMLAVSTFASKDFKCW